MTGVAVETQAAQAANLSKIYGTGAAAVRALASMVFQVRESRHA
jgi:hypothetical protein